MRAFMWWRRAVARLSRGRLDDELRAEIQRSSRASPATADWRRHEPGGRGGRRAARLRQRRERPRADARRLGLPVARQPAAGRALCGAPARPQPSVHRGRGAVALARSRRRGGGVQRGRCRALPPARCRRSRQPSRFQGQPDVRRRELAQGRVRCGPEPGESAARCCRFRGRHRVPDRGRRELRGDGRGLAADSCGVRVAGILFRPRRGAPGRPPARCRRSWTVAGAVGHQRTTVANGAGGRSIGRQSRRQHQQQAGGHRRRRAPLQRIDWRSARPTSSCRCNRRPPSSHPPPQPWSASRSGCTRAWRMRSRNRRWRRCTTRSDHRWRAPASCGSRSATPAAGCRRHASD